MAWIIKFANGVDRLTKVLGHIASALLLFMIALVTLNVVGRYVIGVSPVWAQELEWHLMPPIALLGVIVLMKEGGHVRVDMLYDRFGSRTKASIDFAAMICGAIISVLLIKYSIGFFNNSFSVLEGSADPGGLPGRWVLKGFLMFGFGLLALQCLANAGRHFEVLISKEEPSHGA